MTIETEVTEKEAREGLAASLAIEVEEDRGRKRETKRVGVLKGHW